MSGEDPYRYLLTQSICGEPHFESESYSQHIV